jgi:putative polyketide hydroxylase
MWPRATALIAQFGEALGVRTEGLGELDEHYIFIYFRADWAELVRGYEADAFLIDQPGVWASF